MPTQGFSYRGDAFQCGDIELSRLAEKIGTPCYVYSGDAILANYRAYAQAPAGIDLEIHYSVKANGSLGVLALMAREGAGFDIVSGGELFRVIQAGGDPAKVVFSGVGKTWSELKYALERGVELFNCESEAETEVLADAAEKMDKRPSVALRVNPNINAETHPYIATGMHEHKFGIPIKQAGRIYERFAGNPHLILAGISCHIGSQIFDSGPFLEALQAMTSLAESLRSSGLPIRYLDLGGGLAVAYRGDETTPSVARHLDRLAEGLRGRNLKLMLEPGRSIVGQAGVLLTTVLYRKRSGEKDFVVVDAGMNDLIRPSLYEAHHEIVPLVRNERPEIVADIVGPVCETGDFLARERKMTDAKPGEVLAVCTAGAYGFVHASNYNARPRPPEVLVRGAESEVIRERETYEDLIRGESA